MAVSTGLLHKLILLVFILNYSVLYAQQKNVVFELDMPGKKVEGSLYGSIKLIDLRERPDYFGRVQIGAQNKIVDVITNTPLSEQLNNSMKQMTGGSGSNGELLLLLRHFEFAETLGNTGRGFFELGAVLFENDNGLYKKLETIDTVLLVTGFDVTKKIQRKGSDFINKLLAFNLRRKSLSDIALKLEQVPNIDSFEKAQLPLYRKELKEGLYSSYYLFSMQSPSRTDFSVEFDRSGNIKALGIPNKWGELKTHFNDGSIYGLVYKGVAYIAGNASKFYPLRLTDNDFYFTGRLSDVDANEVALAYFMFGVMGAAIAGSNTSVFEMKLDHLTGQFKKIRKVRN